MGMIPESFLEPLQWFSEYLTEQLKPDQPSDEQVVHKGFFLFRQGSVTELKLEKEDAVTGVVQDVTPVKVNLDLNLPYLSECSCPGEGMCRHQMAVFFQLLSHNGSVSTWVDEWRRPLREQKSAKALGIGRAKDLLKSTGQLKPDYQTWSAAFRESFDVIMIGNGTPKPYLINELFSVYERRLKAGAPFEKEWKNLYLLIANVISFQQLLLLADELGHDEKTISHHYRHIFQNLLDDIEQLTYKLSVQSLPFAFDEFIEQLKDETAILITEDAVIDYERIQLFRLLWTDLFKQKSWREEMMASLPPPSRMNFSSMVGLIHLHILLGSHEDAIQLIEECDSDITPYFFYWFEHLDSKHMEFYIVHFISLTKDYLSYQDDYFASRQFMNMALKTITPYCTEKDRYDLLERAFVHMLPYSFRDYHHFLFEKEEYGKWMELQTYAGYQLDTVSNDMIKILQNNAPEVLLPLYHQAIQADLDGKNRTYYKQAVRKLKKLRTLYRKMKRLDDWNDYFDILLSRTKRLRAFQEECKRGKLIDA